MGKCERQGSVYLLVLLVMISSLSLVAGLQHVLLRRTVNLEQDQTEQKLRNALLLGLQQSVGLLAEDEDLTVDGPEDAWMKAKTFTSTEGVLLQLQLTDAQSRFNLNHLSLPIIPAMPRTWMDIFADLVKGEGLQPDPVLFTFLQQQIDEHEIWFESPEMLSLILPENTEILEITNLLSALPRPKNRPLPMNINTVQPEILRALVGDSLQGWVDSILAARSYEPIRNLEGSLRTLPSPLRPLLRAVLDIHCEYVTATMVAELNHSEQTLTALLKRSGGKVEVMRCQW